MGSSQPREFSKGQGILVRAVAGDGAAAADELVVTYGIVVGGSLRDVAAQSLES
jgi:hypothetical protein